jgi:hypothetical protein
MANLRNDRRGNPRPGTRWAAITNYPGDYSADTAIVVDDKGNVIGAPFKSLREARRNAARIPGASAHRIGE